LSKMLISTFKPAGVRHSTSAGVAHQLNAPVIPLLRAPGARETLPKQLLANHFTDLLPVGPEISTSGRRVAAQIR
ncbi:hypothetical protein ACCT30_37400, partial [Rhizobium ruizarguesonis]